MKENSSKKRTQFFEAQFEVNLFKKRRQALAKKMEKNSALLLFSHPQYTRNPYVLFPYRQDSDFFYLTGFEEPEALFLFRPQAEPESVLFVLPNDIQKERWEGWRHGIQQTKEIFQIDQVLSRENLEEETPKILKGVSKIYCKLFSHSEWDERLRNLLLRLKLLRGQGGRVFPNLEEASSLIGKMRLYKSPYEIEQIEKAVDIASQAHQELMKHSFPGQKERRLHGLFLQEIMKRGAKREAYESILASGSNATILHYRDNNKELRKGDLILVDAGAEYNHYASDITRTYPVQAPFSSLQKRIYQKLLNVQKTLIESIRPGLSFQELQDQAVTLMIEVMLDENLLKGKKEEIKSSQSYKCFYPHSVGHWLGMDVHDSGEIKREEGSQILEEGMCLTIEPGLYIPINIKSLPYKIEDSSLDKNLKGLGFRIEDDILVTKNGFKNLSASCPKEIEELESLIGLYSSSATARLP